MISNSQKLGIWCQWLIYFKIPISGKGQPFSKLPRAVLNCYQSIKAKVAEKFCCLRKTIISNLAFVSLTYTKTLFHSYATISPIFSAKQPTQIKLALDYPTAPSKHQGKSSHKFRRLRKTIISNLTFVLVTYTKTLFQPYATISSIISAKQPTQINSLRLSYSAIEASRQERP